MCMHLIARDQMREHMCMCVKALRRICKGPKKGGLFIDLKS